MRSRLAGEPSSACGVRGLVEKGVSGGEQGTAPPETPLHRGQQCVPPGERGPWWKKEQGERPHPSAPGEPELRARAAWQKEPLPTQEADGGWEAVQGEAPAGGRSWEVSPCSPSPMVPGQGWGTGFGLLTPSPWVGVGGNPELLWMGPPALGRPQQKTRDLPRPLPSASPGTTQWKHEPPKSPSSFLALRPPSQGRKGALSIGFI